jgi:hypothetical protein
MRSLGPRYLQSKQEKEIGFLSVYMILKVDLVFVNINSFNKDLGLVSMYLYIYFLSRAFIRSQIFPLPTFPHGDLEYLDGG